MSGGLFSQGVSCCDSVCLAWQRVSQARQHLLKVKADAYVMRYEEELCDAQIDFENVFASFKKYLKRLSASRSDSEAVGELVGLMELTVHAATEAEAEDFGGSTNELLRAVKNDVVAFAKKVKVNTRLGVTSSHYKKPNIKKMSTGAKSRTLRKALASNN